MRFCELLAGFYCLVVLFVVTMEDELSTVVSSVDPATLASKRVVYVGGLPDRANVAMVRAAMIPFGDIRSLDMVRVTPDCSLQERSGD